MASAPVLVTAYTGDRLNPRRLSDTGLSTVRALPPVSSFAFTDILRSADSPDFQHAIGSIAEICARNHMSLADEYTSHLPPLGEITTVNPTATRQQLFRPGMRCPLTSVPEASSSSSEGSHHSRQSKDISSFRKQHYSEGAPLRKIRIGSMGRTVSVGATTALAASEGNDSDVASESRRSCATHGDHGKDRISRITHSDAVASLQRLMTNYNVTSGTQPG